MFEVQDSETV